MIIDNKTRKFINEVQDIISTGDNVHMLSDGFSINAYNVLKRELSSVFNLELLLNKYDMELTKIISGSDKENIYKNNLQQAFIARECLNWIIRKVKIKKLDSSSGVSIYCFDNNSKVSSYFGDIKFNLEGLGVIASESSSMVMEATNNSKELLSRFKGYWDNQSLDIKEDVCKALEYIASDKNTSYIYYTFLYNIFNNLLDDIDEESIIKSKTGFKDTLVWNKLYKFQKDGVLGAIDKLEKYNGCIIADSVGLGKTFEALAIIKYYELRNDRVLVLCPKKLRENWSLYTINDKRNLLNEDRFNYDILNHTDLTREKGYSGEINLETINWGNYDLVVIDESHNFRNNDARTNTITRYKRLMNQIIKSGVKTKVLMLSATPVNNRLNDLKNQVSFITEGRDGALSEYGLSSISTTLKNSQTQFNRWLKLPEEDRTTSSLLESLNFDYFKLLDILTIARSRKHIEKYYDISDIGKFPERLEPDNIKSDIDIKGEFPSLFDVNKTIKKLNLASYSPLSYVRMDKKEEYDRKYDQPIREGKSLFKQIDRDASLLNLMRVNLLKRMESSIFSFNLTLQSIKENIEKTLNLLESYNYDNSIYVDIEDLDVENIDSELEDLIVGNKVKVLIQDIDMVRWKEDLISDLNTLNKLLDSSSKVSAERDDKLNILKNTILHKVQNPYNSNNKKIIVFTAFSDTAEYLYNNIADWAKQSLGINSALVIGSGANKTTLAIKKDLNNILTNFSPISKERAKVDTKATEEIDILIATDCISEGQNLQDCDTLINYDIHWNPVRIIQRFGRVDRLGSKNNKIKLINFWPNMELDEYINLEARVSGKMALLDVSATGEENIIDKNSKEMNDLEYRRKQMKQLQSSVLDLEDIDGGVSITDMTFNDFRMDLSSFIKENKGRLEKDPVGFYAVANEINNEISEGVIFCLRDINSKVNTETNYAVAPYYIVYVNKDGSIKYNYQQIKKSLDCLKKLHIENKGVCYKAVDIFNRETTGGKNMKNYKNLLEKAIESITGKSEEKGIESLFSLGGTSFSKDKFNGIEDFEVVSYMIVVKR